MHVIDCEECISVNVYLDADKFNASINLAAKKKLPVTSLAIDRFNTLCVCVCRAEFISTDKL